MLSADTDNTDKKTQKTFHRTRATDYSVIFNIKHCPEYSLPSLDIYTHYRYFLSFHRAILIAPVYQIAKRVLLNRLP